MSRAESSSIKDHRSREDLRGLSRERVRELLQYDEEDKDKKDKKDKKDEKDEEEKDEEDEDEKDEKNKEDKEGKKDKEDKEDDNVNDKDKTHESKIWLPLLHDKHIINQAPTTQTSSKIFLIEIKNSWLLKQRFFDKWWDTLECARLTRVSPVIEMSIRLSNRKYSE